MNLMIFFLGLYGDIFEDSWYLDTGSSSHMAGNKTFFNYQEDAKSGNVRFGDGSTINLCKKRENPCSI